MQRATTTFHVGTKDGTRTIETGTLLEDSDPIVKGCSMFFEPDEDSTPAKKSPARRASGKSAAKTSADE
jgi:hypothetical protein